ncbi:unnamed protein product, partial [Symbiodinium pilosum]
GFSNFDRLRSKKVLIPESKAFVSYLIEFLKIIRTNRGEALLSSEVDLDRQEKIIKDVLRKGFKDRWVDEFGTNLVTMDEHKALAP